jgi:hypothetical protein
MKFKENLEPIPTSDTYYDLFLGGYFKPEKMLENKEEVEKVKQAIATVKRFISEAIEQGVIEEI